MTDSTPHRHHRIGRRGFLVVSSLAGTGLTLAFALRSSQKASADPAAKIAQHTDFRPNALVRISSSGAVTLVSKQMEVGQGVKTSLPMVLAEELDVNWRDVTVEQGDLDEAYGSQFSAASTSVQSNYDTCRLLGATARTLLVSAAALRWGVPASECHARAGSVYHKATGRSLGYGALAARAAALPVPHRRAVRLKKPEGFTLIGTRVGDVDSGKIVTGAPLFGIDIHMPGMRYATYVKCPVFGGRVASANLSFIKTLPGVHDAFVVRGRGGILSLMPGVAIVADSTWAAFSARKQLEVTWDHPPAGDQSWSHFSAEARRKSREPATTLLHEHGDVEGALAQAHTRVEAWYVYPFICHAALEPLNCVASYKNGVMELWTASQSPAWARDHVATSLGLGHDKVVFHPVRAGGAFGRRLSSDYVVEAAAIAQQSVTPIKLTWSREDEMQHDHYRAGGFHLLRGGVNADGDVTAWRDHHISMGLEGRPGAALERGEFPALLTASCTLEQSVIDCNIPIGAWRAPGANVHAWAIQSFIDELAVAARRDPLEFRLQLLGSQRDVFHRLFSRGGSVLSPSRMATLLHALAQESQWGRQLPRGQAQGLAFHVSCGTYVAMVADVTISREGQLKVDKVVCVCDAGEQIVNLSGAEAQVQGAIIDGLSAAWFQKADIQGGRAVPVNFHDYPVLRMPDAPAQIEVHFLRSDNPLSGLGEPALPVIAPAVCNAIARATGVRVRQLPLAGADLRWR